MVTRFAATLAAVVCLLVLGAAPASAHARLIASQPSAGATLDAAPGEILLEFNEPIEASFAQVQAFGPDGARVDAGEPVVEGPRVRLPLQPLTAGGGYQVAFRVVSVDGHPVESTFAFTLALPAPPPPQEPAAAPAPEPSAAPEPALPPVKLQTAGAGTVVGLLVARFVNYVALTAVVGLLLAAAWLLADGTSLGALQQRATRAAAAVAVLWALSAVGLFVFGLSNAAARPVGAVLAPDVLGRFAGTRFGTAVIAQGVAAVAVALVAVLAKSRTVARVALGAAALGAFAPAWWGHAGTSDVRVLSLASDWAHVLAVTAWVGGLAVLALLVLRGTAENPRDALLPAGRFSRLASWALAVVLATGVVNAVVYMGAPANLWGTNWGRLVLLKVALLGGIAYLGWVNRRRSLPALEQSGRGARQRFRRLALTELGIMVLALGTATALSSSVPAEAEAAARIQSIATAFGDGQVNMTLDPAQTGDNVLHLYFFGRNAQLREVTDAAVVLRSGPETVDAELFVAGPGHYTGLAVPIRTPGGYQVEIRGNVDGTPQRATGVVTVR